MKKIKRAGLLSGFVFLMSSFFKKENRTKKEAPDMPKEDYANMSQDDSYRQIAQSLAHIEKYFIPEEAEARESRIKAYITKSVTIIGVLLSGLIGSWELGSYLFEKYQIEQMADRYAAIATSIYYEENNPAVALSFVDKALELDEESYDYRYLKTYIEGLNVCRLLMNLDRPYTKEELDQAHHAIAQALFLESLTPDKAEPYILKGQVHAALGEYDMAKQEFQKALAMDPSNDFAWVRMAYLDYVNKDYEKAFQALDKSKSINPESKWAYLWEGITYVAMKDWQKAQAAYEKSLEIDPKFDLAFYNLGWMFLKTKNKDYDKARDNFRKALSINPNYKECYYALGMVYGYQDSYEMAKMYLDKALELDPTFLTALKWRSIVFLEMKDYEQALDDLSKALEIDPSQPDLYIRRAKVYMKLKRYGDAAMDLNLASNLTPDNPKIWRYFGNIMKAKGNFEMAQKHYAKALSINPNDSTTYYERAVLFDQNDSPDLAIADYDKAISLSRHNRGKYSVKKGRFLLRINRLDDARSVFESVLNDPKVSLAAKYYLGMTCYRQNDLENAKKYLQEFVERNPDNQDAVAMLSEVVEAMNASSLSKK